jgi:hypothetical protein
VVVWHKYRGQGATISAGSAAEKRVAAVRR